jgi:hypothetical protein
MERTHKHTHKLTCRTTTGEVLWTSFMTADEYDRYCRKREEALTRRPYVHPVPDEGDLHINAGTIEIGKSREERMMRELIDATLQHFGFGSVAPDEDIICRLLHIRDGVMSAALNEGERALINVLLFLARQPRSVIRMWCAPWRLT